MDYTVAQQRAIDTTDDHLQIIACAGSGKTRVVTARIINILQRHATDGITPENIVAFTFTDKAAAELKDRITQAYREAFGHVEGIAGMYVGTIHGFCLDLLQRYLNRYLKYDVLDGVRQRLLIDRNFQKSGMASLGLKRWLDSNTYIQLLSMLREADADLQLLQGHAVRAALDSYQGLLNRHRYLDFAEIQEKAVKELLQNEDLRARVRARVKYLTVDEYQDVSPLQESLIRQIYELGANLCVVGDDDQNIYQWRGSDVQHIVEFTGRYQNIVQIPLDVNFRSTSAIVDVAHRIVEVNTTRLPKMMQSGGKQEFQRGDLLCLKFTDPDEEAEWIVEKICDMRGLPYLDGGRVRGLSWSDFAVLYRSVKNCAPALIAALRKRNVPYIVTGMSGLFDTAEAQAATAIFEFMTQELSAESLKERWHKAAVGITDEQLERGIAALRDRQDFGPKKRHSTYNLQRTYLDFLEAVALREEQVEGGRGEIVYYNLGKFSQVISDFEEIHFKSAPEEKYRSFVQFLRYQAPGYYPEGGQDAAYAVPDAVRIMTVHQAKGMEFPVVFLPCLQRNRFPAKRQHNRVWDILPRQAIHNADRFDGDEEDERRLFYVAVTRSEKYLFCSWAPDSSPTNKLYKRPSVFWEELTRHEKTLTRDPAELQKMTRIPPEARKPLVNVELSFSDLKYFFDCPYQFKLRLLYGFNPPLHEALGYGRSLHNVLAEIHRRALVGEIITRDEIPDLVSRHLQVRYAYPELEEALQGAAEASTAQYLREHTDQLSRLEHVEEVIQLTLPNGIVVNGRIDLIKRTDTNEVAIVDFKSDRRAQAEDITSLQLHVYALGYEQRFGKRADLLEVHNLDAGGSRRELVDDNLMRATVREVTEAGQKLRENRLERLPAGEKKCVQCDLVGICRTPIAIAAQI